MQKLFVVLLLLATVCATLNSQTDSRLAAVKTPLTEVEQLQLPYWDNKQLLAEEMARRGPGIAPRFAQTMTVDVSPATHGQWEVRGNQAVWRLRVPSPGAKSLNFGFDQFVMPAGGQMLIYTPDLTEIQGPFTPADNDDHEELWTPVIAGDEMVIEVQVPVANKHLLRLHLKSVNHDFLGFTSVASVLSGSCNLDVVCSAVDGWGIVDQYRDIIQSVAVISTGGGTFCTGFLVNNARQDCTPLFMTANHCGINQGNAPSLVVYWNFVNSVCRAPNGPASGQNGNGVLSDFNTGSVWRASAAASDATIVELDDPVSPTANAWFAGWDARDVLEPDTVIAIHHPSTDEKRISFQFDGVYRGEWGSGGTAIPTGNHLIIEDWEVGTTEGGSSGSPIFDSEKRVIGQLHGGAAACGNNSYDSYGWFHSSWEGNGTPTTRLRDWLDPDNTGVLVIDGRAQLLCSYFAQAQPAVQSLCAPATASYIITTSENFANPVSLSLANLPAGLTAVFDQQTVAPGESTQMTIIGTESLAGGAYTFQLLGNDGENASSQTLALNITSGVPVLPALLNPTDQAIDQLTALLLSWQGISQATGYDVELATDVDFNEVISSGTAITGTTFLAGGLNISTVYYWHVRAHNICGTGDWSAVRSFETGALNCSINPAQTEGLTIGPAANTLTVSTLLVNQPGTIASVRLSNLRTNHTYTGDLSATLTSPAGTVINLFGQPDCDQGGMDVSFDDTATATAATFLGTCDNAGTSIVGDFQPQQPLSTFSGEPAAGLWTLTIRDNFNIDGGDLLGWNLEFCTLIPSTVSVTPSVETATTCADGFAVLDLTLGTGFNNDITLSVDNLPAGATATFETNPVTPGTTVSVTIGGLASAGSFPFTFRGDDGADTATAVVLLDVLAAPAAPQLNAPGNAAVDVPLNTLINWDAILNADDYVLTLSANADLSAPLQVLEIPNTLVAVPGLLYNTTYFWGVTPRNACGEGTPSAVFSFTTVPDTRITPAQPNLITCLADGASAGFTLGEGLSLSQEVGIVVIPAADFSGFTQSFDAASGELTLSWTNFLGIAPGTYNLSVTVTNGAYSNTTSQVISIAAAPGLTTLQSPLNEAMINSQSAVPFTWTAVAGATSYRLEIAPDDGFTNIVYSGNSAGLTQFANIPAGQYFWRVTSSNNCGEAVSGFFVFAYSTTNTLEVAGARLDIWPNPTPGPVRISLTGDLVGTLDVTVFAANGQRLRDYQLPTLAGQQLLDLTGLPAGLYLLRISNGQSQATARVIVQ